MAPAVSRASFVSGFLLFVTTAMMIGVATPATPLPTREGSQLRLGMFIRFVVNNRDAQSGRRQGLFYAAYELERAGTASPHDVEALARIHDWFAKNLCEPTRASISTRPHAKAQALSWFRETATEHVSRMREIQSILSAYGVATETLRTRRPGYVVYEDDHQVVAQPFADTPT